MSPLPTFWLGMLLLTSSPPAVVHGAAGPDPGSVEPATATDLEPRLACLFALDAETAWVGGQLEREYSSEGGYSTYAVPALFTTHDGGATWKALDIAGVADGRWVSSLFFLDRLTGWAALVSQGPGGGEPPLIRTLDGGETWSYHELELPIVPVPSAAYKPVSLEFASREVGFFRIDHTIVEDEEAIFVTTDGGRTWSFSHGRGASAQSGQRLSIAADATRWKLGGFCEGCDSNAVFRSHDQGLTWQESSSPRSADGQ